MRDIPVRGYQGMGQCRQTRNAQTTCRLRAQSLARAAICSKPINEAFYFPASAQVPAR